MSDSQTRKFAEMLKRYDVDIEECLAFAAAITAGLAIMVALEANKKAEEEADDL